MSLFIKQDFTPPILSRRWIAIRFRPNMLLQSRNHIISILESGLMFREDSAKVEQLSPAAEELWKVSGGGWSGWLTNGERVLSVLGIGAAVYVFPPKFHGPPRNTAIHITSYAVVPLFVRMSHRLLAKGSSLVALLGYMKQYLVAARRTMACLKEYKLLNKNLSSINTILESCTALLYNQQTELALLMARSSSAILGNFPWLFEDVDWESIYSIGENKMDAPCEGDLVKIHHAFLVVQSTLLKHISMAHFTQPLNVRKTYKNHNERIYWLHNHLINYINDILKENHESLDRMYRLLRNCSFSDDKDVKRSIKINDTWLYSEVHSEVVRTSIELKIALEKSINLDKLLDSCSTNKQKIDLSVLDKDLDDLVDNISKCLTTAQNSHLRLSKIKSKFDLKKAIDIVTDAVETSEEAAPIIQLDNQEPEAKDEVYYFVKTEDDIKTEKAQDVITAPGKKEKDVNSIVLVELKRKLVKREDLMRDREKKALAETMPELLGNLPEFPRQNPEVILEKRGYICKLKEQQRGLFEKVAVKNKRRFFKRVLCLEFHDYENADLINAFESTRQNNKRYFTIIGSKEGYIIVKYCKDLYKNIDSNEKYEDKMCINKEANDFRCSKKDLELSPSSSESDFEVRKEKQELLQDIRRNRVARKKNYPSNGVSVASDMNEGLKPVEYSFGTGIAIASVLQVNKRNFPHLAAEEVFIGDGEVSGDSGNED